MGAKRMRSKKAFGWERLTTRPKEALPEPPRVTCPGCGATAFLTDHACRACGLLFYERPDGKTRRKLPARSSEPDPAIEAFTERMGRIEGWTRILCALAGVLFAVLAVMCTVSALGIVGPVWGSFYGFVFFGILSIVCLLRGLARPDADSRFLSGLASLVSFRRLWFR